MLKTTNDTDELISFVYPNDILANPIACLKRSILAPTNQQVNMYNIIILKCIQGDQRLYMAADSLKEVSNAGLQSSNSTLDFVTKQTPPGLPSHTITIKTNAIYQLLRNFSLDRGLVKNVRVLITEVGTRLVTVHLIREIDGILRADDEDILIPRISFSSVNILSTVAKA